MADSDFKKARIVRAFRFWDASRDDKYYPPLSGSSFFDQTPLTMACAQACVSLFQLVEAQLERRLVRGPCCSKVQSSDEIALIALLDAAPMTSRSIGSDELPHGLPASIHWAAMTVRRELEWQTTGVEGAMQHSTTGLCPFDQPKLGAQRCDQPE